MAIEVLEGRAHTYRHDLESFFDVFLWVIIRYGQETDKNLPNTSRLRRWYAGSYEDIADIKRSQMDKSRFKGILNEFPLGFDGLEVLAKELRDNPLSISGGAFTRTYRNPDKLYRPIIDAFDRAIAKYMEGESDEKV